MPSLRKKIYLFLSLAIATLIAFFCLLGFALITTSLETDTENMMIYHGLFIDENKLENDLVQLPKGGLIAAYRDLNKMPKYLKVGFSWETMESQTLYEKELINTDGKSVYVYALTYNLKNKRGKLYITSEYLQGLEHQMRYEQSLWLESATTLLMVGTGLLLTICLIFALFYYMLLSPFQAVSDWLAEPSKEIPYERIKYQELIGIVQSYKSSSDKQKELIEKEEFFLSTMSHELRTPIAIISSSVELLERMSVDKKVVTVNKRISYAIQNMNYLAKTLLWLSRKNNRPLTETPINLSNLVSDVIADNQYLVAGRDITLAICCEIEPNYEIYDNYGAVQLVLVNLIRNALQHSANGDIVIQLKNGALVVENPFESNETCNSKEAESYGFGLYLVKKICAARGFVFDIDYQKTKVVARVDLNR